MNQVAVKIESSPTSQSSKGIKSRRLDVPADKIKFEDTNGITSTSVTKELSDNTNNNGKIQFQLNHQIHPNNSNSNSITANSSAGQTPIANTNVHAITNKGLSKNVNQVSSTSSLDSAISTTNTNSNVSLNVNSSITSNQNQNDVGFTVNPGIANTNPSTLVINTTTTYNGLSNANISSIPPIKTEPTATPKMPGSTEFITPNIASSSNIQQHMTSASVPTSLSHTNHNPTTATTTTTNTLNPLPQPRPGSMQGQQQYTINGQTLGIAATPILIATTAPTVAGLDMSVPPQTMSADGASASSSSTITNPPANVPEFLYQLIKMLTDDHRDIIEWSKGKIEVHNPHRLESQVLNKYFRHSKYASFQRQLNYFGFRKLAGKGKMAPCSYVNELATADLRSLLKMKRKTSAKEAAKSSDDLSKALASHQPQQQKQQQQTLHTPSSSLLHVADPVAGTATSTIPNPSSSTILVKEDTISNSNLKIAVGKGIKHSLNGYLKSSSSSNHQQNNNMTTKIIFPPLQSLSKNAQSSTSATINNPLLTSSDLEQFLEQQEQSRTIDPFTIAQSAVGKGVQHQFTKTALTVQSSPQDALKTSNKSVNVNPLSSTSTSVTALEKQQPNTSSDTMSFTFLDPSQLGMGIENSLTELQNNFRNAHNDATSNEGVSEEDGGYSGGSMKRESSLVALAMIPDLGTNTQTSLLGNGTEIAVSSSSPLPGPSSSSVQDLKTVTDDALMSFIDFPPGFDSD